MPSKFRQKMLCYLRILSSAKNFFSQKFHKADSQKLYQSYMISSNLLKDMVKQNKEENKERGGNEPKRKHGIQ